MSRYKYVCNDYVRNIRQYIVFSLVNIKMCFFLGIIYWKALPNHFRNTADSVSSFFYAFNVKASDKQVLFVPVHLILHLCVYYLYFLLIENYFFQSSRIMHGSSKKCLAISQDRKKLVMEDCNLEESRQKWKFENYDPSKKL